MSGGKEFIDWLKEHYSNVDSEKLAQVYETNYHSGDFLSVFTAAYDTLAFKRWVISDKCTWPEEKKQEYALRYVFAKETCDQFETYLRDQGLTKAKYKKWISGRPTETHPVNNDIKKMFDDLKKKNSGKRVKKVEENETSLKVKIKPQKKEIQNDKKEESKPKKE